MKIKVNVRNLKEKLGIVSKAVGDSSVTNATKNVLFVVNDKANATLMCYDDIKHINISTNVVVEADSTGEACIDCKMLMTFLGKLPMESDVSIDFANGQAILRCDKTRVAMATMDAASFPRPNTPTVTSTINVDVATLSALVGNVSFATKENPNNRMMEGINIVKKDGKLTVVALDGFRVAMADMPINNGNDIDIIVDAKLLVKALSSLTGSVTIAVGTNNIVFNDENTRVSMQLIEGSYFKISNFLSITSDKKLTVDKETLRAAIDRATIFITMDDKKPIVFDCKDNVLKLSIQTTLGSTEDEIDVVKEGADMKIAFNPHFLIETLKVIKDKDISLEMSTAKAPLLIRGNGYLYVILPVNLPTL